MSEFKIAAAQVASARGDIAANIRTHAAAVTSAAEQGVSVLVFPELSLIGYEPDLATELAIAATDARLAPLAALAHRHQMAVVVGASLQNSGTKPGLGAILLTADGSARTYAKMHLGAASRPTSRPAADRSHSPPTGRRSASRSVRTRRSRLTHRRMLTAVAPSTPQGCF